MKILLVDDSMTMRRIQKTQLQQLGIADVVEANNGKEALDCVSKNPDFSCVLLDWNMPEMDGPTFLKTIRANEKNKDLKVIMCTSNAEKEKVMEALRAGANGYIIKPFAAEALKSKLGL
jgi:two-component system chemotaxis response regulator CheY